MNRRRALLSIAGVSSLAGCSSTIKGAVRTGPPYFEEVEISGEEEAIVGDDIELEISVKNTGGREGDFTGTLTIGSGPLSIEESVVIESVPVATRKSATIGPFSVPYADEYTFRITDYNAEHTFKAKPQQLVPTQRFALEGLSVTAGEPIFMDGAFTEDYSGEASVVPPNGLLAIVPISVTTDSDTERPPASSFSTSGGRRSDIEVHKLHNRFVDYSDSNGVADTAMAFVLDYTSGKQGFEVELELGGGSRPESSWSYEGRDVPETKIVNFQTPDEVELSQTYTISIECENVGSAPGIVRGFVDSRSDKDDSWDREFRIREEIEANTQKTITREVRGDTIGSTQYRIRPRRAYDSTEVVPLDLKFGQSYTGREGEKRTVNVERGTYSKYIYNDINSDSDKSYSASSGHEIVFVKVGVKNTNNEEIRLPPTHRFTAHLNGEELDSGYPFMYWDFDFVTPISGQNYGVVDELQPSESTIGYIPFEIPQNADGSQIMIQYQRSDWGTVTEEVYWNRKK